MTRKIFKSIIFVAGIILLASVVIIMGCVYEYFEDIRENGLEDELELAAAAIEDGQSHYLENIHSDHYRITWIDKDGTVLHDTATGGKSDENHLERAEVRRALEEGEGWSNRYSNTLLEKTMYYARRMEDGTVLRISTKSATLGLLVIGMLQPILFVLLLALVVSGVLAYRLSKRIVRPLNDLDLERPLENDTYEEVSPLLNRINKQRKEIDAQFKKLQQREAQFAQITACMNEGLVLLDGRGIVLSINAAADKIFALEEDSEGKDFLTICRDHEISLCIRDAMESGHSEICRRKFGREYQFDVSRIESAGKVLGAVLLIFDITERVLAERNRREFTANVSHELKTPLQGIIGSAELIENGMVRQEDLPRFVGHMRKEASRLVALVGDIIRLSQLDEKKELVKEEVDLLEIAGEVCEEMHAAAQERNVSINISGGKAVVCAVRKLLYEIMHNLCENAVKYNVEGGSVDVEVAGGSDRVVLTVADTGIGIPKEHIDRVFERFYRVDKSHSKDSGGTGLGLSIVKHAVAYHHGTIDVTSEAGKGTEIRVEIPCN